MLRVNVSSCKLQVVIHQRAPYSTLPCAALKSNLKKFLLLKRMMRKREDLRLTKSGLIDAWNLDDVICSCLGLLFIMI